MQLLVRFDVLYRIKPHVPLLEIASVNSFEFQPCDRSSQAEYLRVSLNTKQNYLMLNTHKSQHGLPGYLILFETHAFASQRQ